MKALSIQQPWAWLIAHGYKDIENRDWDTRYRGFLLLHAGKRFDENFFAGETLSLPFAQQICGSSLAAIMPKTRGGYDRGGIVGYASLSHVVTASSSQWFTGEYGFVLLHGCPTPLLPLRGQLGLFEVPAEIEAEIEAIRVSRRQLGEPGG